MPISEIFLKTIELRIFIFFSCIIGRKLPPRSTQVKKLQYSFYILIFLRTHQHCGRLTELAKFRDKYDQLVIDFEKLENSGKNESLKLEKYIERQEIELTLKLLQKIVPQWKRSSYSDSF